MQQTWWVPGENKDPTTRGTVCIPHPLWHNMPAIRADLLGTAPKNIGSAKPTVKRAHYFGLKKNGVDKEHKPPALPPWFISLVVNVAI